LAPKTNKDLLRLKDLGRDEIGWILRTAGRMKRERSQGIPHPHLAGKSLGMIFNKSSTRTRISFEVGMFQLGGHTVFLTGQQLQMGRGETVADSARIFSRYLDGLVIRTFDHAEVEELAAQAAIPVINALTDKFHPCQILADIFTIMEKRGTLEGVKVAYIGDGNNVANSWLLGASIMGIDIDMATPKGYEPDSDVIAEACSNARSTGGRISLCHDPAEAARDADVLYTDTWISMGQDSQAEQRKRDFMGFCVDDSLVAAARPDVMVMHCLPAHRDEEISGETLDGPNSVVWDEAENRLHVQKAILLSLMHDDATGLYQ